MVTLSQVHPLQPERLEAAAFEFRNGVPDANAVGGRWLVRKFLEV